MSSQVVVDFARRFIGSHYLWGAGGSTPERRDGVWYRPGAVTLVPLGSRDPANAMVGAAQCSVSGHYVCAGRFMKIPGGRYATASDPDLRRYLETVERTKPNIPPFASRFTPRVVKGENVSNDGRLVWGEDCRGKRHFDCISFVNWVLSWTTSTFWDASIPQYGNDSSGTKDVALGAPVIPGDILLRGTEHIGFLCENGKVIQAQDHATGVHEDEAYDPKLWTARRRLPPSAFLRNAQEPGSDGVARITGLAR